VSQTHEDERPYEAQCSGCRREFTNYSGGATHCLRCTRDDLSRAHDGAYRSEVALLVELARHLVSRAANQAALFDSTKERKLDDISAALARV
jgi:hypothetical protein